MLPMEFTKLLTNVIQKVQELLPEPEKTQAELLFQEGDCQILSQSSVQVEMLVNVPDTAESVHYAFEIVPSQKIVPYANGTRSVWDRYSYACLLLLQHELTLQGDAANVVHKKYSREGMVERVLAERRERAEKAEYSMQWAANIYGDHYLFNEKGEKYTVFLRDFDNEIGYSDSMDAKLNKLGTTKHIMFAFKKLKENPVLKNKLDTRFPFVEICLDPLNDYKISWHYKGELPVIQKLLLDRYFNGKTHIEHTETSAFFSFVKEVQGDDFFRIRPEVTDKIEAAYEQQMLDDLALAYTPDFSSIATDLMPYQKEGIIFSLFRKGAIIADEMGLGKTVQAVGAAVLKQDLFNFKTSLVVCPASLKEQWKREIERFAGCSVCMVQGNQEERFAQYAMLADPFAIVTYETVLRDLPQINAIGIDFLILDEAQKVKNYETQIANAVKNIERKHILVLTGTPIENKLIDIYSIMGIVDPYFFGPLWEFSYQHCLFDPANPDKINGYYDLQKLNKKLDAILLRREKRKVLDQLPNVQQYNIPVELSPLQLEMHCGYAKGIASVLHKKFLTPFDLQKMNILLTNMRMVCNSTFLVDDSTNESPKLAELHHILFDKLDVLHTGRKVVIFSEWVKTHKLIGKMLRAKGVGFVELNGRIPVKSRGELIKRFETNNAYQVFLSTETGGAGLNLQVADTLINFELPWNPSKKNQRIGRIDRIGQKHAKLTIFNLIAKNSIEQQIASGLLVKQDLFDGVLGKDATTNIVDFSSKGKSLFIEQLEKFIQSAEQKPDAIPMKYRPAQIAKPMPSGAKHAVPTLVAGPETEPVGSEQQALADTSIDPELLRKVLASGMEFFSNMFRLSTGNDLPFSGQTVEFDAAKNEVVLRFSMKQGEHK